MPNEFGFENDPGNEHIDWYRRWAKGQGFDLSNRSNFEITGFLGQTYEKEGLSHGDIETRFGPEFSNAYLDQKNRVDPNQGFLDDLASGFKSGSYGLASTGVGFAGLTMGLLGAEESEAAMMRTAADLQEEAAQDRPTIDRASDVRWDRPSEVARFLVGGFGEAAPSVIESTASYFAGGGIGYGIAKMHVKRSIKKSIAARISSKSAAEAVEDLLGEVVKARARKGFAIGSMAGIGVSSIGLGQGEIYTHLYPYTQLDKTDKDFIDHAEARNISLGFGTVSGSLDFLSAGTMLSKLTGTPQKVAETYLKRLIMNLPQGIVIEGGTEAAQEFINISAEKYAHGKEIDFNN